MTPYKQALTDAMTELGRDLKTRFIGYGVTIGKAMGTLSGVPETQLIETPVAENLMCGIATGMALAGLRPVVYFERFDFVLNAADAIVNHLDKIERISRGAFRAGVIIRVTVGSISKPLFTGPTHTQNFTQAFRDMVDMPVHQITRPDQFIPAYRCAHADMIRGISTMIVELKDKI